MDTEWDGGWAPLPEEINGTGSPACGDQTHVQTTRLDSILPLDDVTNAVSSHAFQVYLSAMLDMVGRCGQPLALLNFGIDDSPAVQFLAPDGAALIGRAVARCLRQETRLQDVVGMGEQIDDFGMASFLVACPLIDEEQAFALAGRLQSAMMTQAGDPASPWITVSVGIAGVSVDAADPASLIARANSALHRARRNGKGCIWRHSDILRRILENQQIEDRIEYGIEDRTDLADNRDEDSEEKN